MVYAEGQQLALNERPSGYRAGSIALDCIAIAVAGLPRRPSESFSAAADIRKSRPQEYRVGKYDSEFYLSDDLTIPVTVWLVDEPSIEDG